MCQLTRPITMQLSTSLHQGRGAHTVSLSPITSNKQPATMPNRRSTTTTTITPPQPDPCCISPAVHPDYGITTLTTTTSNNNDDGSSETFTTTTLHDSQWPLPQPLPLPYDFQTLHLNPDNITVHNAWDLFQTPSNLRLIVCDPYFVVKRCSLVEKRDLLTSELRAWRRDGEVFWFDACFFARNGFLDLSGDEWDGGVTQGSRRTLADMIPLLDAAIRHGLTRLADCYLTYLTNTYFVVPVAVVAADDDDDDDNNNDDDDAEDPGEDQNAMEVDFHAGFAPDHNSDTNTIAKDYIDIDIATEQYPTPAATPMPIVSVSVSVPTPKLTQEPAPEPTLLSALHPVIPATTAPPPAPPPPKPLPLAPGVPLLSETDLAPLLELNYQPTYLWLCAYRASVQLRTWNLLLQGQG